jgi:ATPase subunit of ABC transporter with duplicated ATPase domains
VTRILELEAETGRPREYPGGWSEFEAARAHARESEEAAYDRHAAERRRFEDLLRARQNQARVGGPMADRRGTRALMSKVRTTERRLERLERVEKPWRPWRLQLSLAPRARGGATALTLAGALVERPGFRLGPVDLELRRGDRVLVSGANGSGKTTLLNALLGTCELAAGQRRVGVGVVVGALEQRRGEFDVDEPLLEPFTRAAAVAAGEARTLLAKFGLGPDELARPARSLSPGERTRTSLAVLAARGVNCVILDEPTNHLDLEAIEQLENALEHFEGTIVLVSHDRRFVESFRAAHILRLETGTDSAHGVRHARVLERYDRRGEEAGRS